MRLDEHPILYRSILNHLAMLDWADGVAVRAATSGPVDSYEVSVWRGRRCVSATLPAALAMAYDVDNAVLIHLERALRTIRPRAESAYA